MSQKTKKAKTILGGVDVLGVRFEGFIHPSTNQAVFSDRGLARVLKIPRSSLSTILGSEEFKRLSGNNSTRPKLLTDNGSRISVLTQSELSILIKILSEKIKSDGNPRYSVPKSMQDAGFPIVLQQSVDEALRIPRDRHEYLHQGATLRQKLEYKDSYHELKGSVFEKGYGVRTLCEVNRQVSGLAVLDADSRRAKRKDWRKFCSGIETTFLTVSNTVHQKAVEASPSKQILVRNLEIASQRTQEIYRIIDAPFD
ncbi:hypothetical protein [Roseofilum casamattae]|uniref:Bro-N domain-containing protein n=1 Tax=Roseofilum casamattae BLCC-M143 TaxID=3022442 RepID=A0ABT7BZ84_9CYAN|nr:hypothetical protein [Roseofilum casamattae]MDJ1184518.1 hypothetical protein [Roseofilum casamattae BLCC-M143]